MSLGWYKEGMYEEDLSKCIFYENKFFFLKYSVFVELGEWVWFKSKVEGRQIFPSGSLAASPLHPHPSLVPIRAGLFWIKHALEDWLANTSVYIISRPVDRKLRHQTLFLDHSWRTSERL